MSRKSKNTFKLTLLVLLLLLSMGQVAPGALKAAPSAGMAMNLAPWDRIVYQRLENGHWNLWMRAHNTLVAVTENAFEDIHPQLDRSGSRVVFASNRSGSYQIYTLDLLSGQLRQLTNTNTQNLAPAWSPDGTQIAFESYRDYQAEIYVMQADGSDPTRLTNHINYDGQPAWSPDGELLAFVSLRSSNSDIWTMESDGNNLHRISARPDSQNPAWSPNGTDVAFDCDANGDGWQEIWQVNTETMEQSEIYAPGEPIDAWVGNWSPDGQYVGFTRVHYTQSGERWTWDSAYAEIFDLQDQMVIRLSEHAAAWHPDWHATDITPPQSQLAALPSYSRLGRDAVQWSGADNAGGAGLRSFDLQFKPLTGTTWIDWLHDTSETSAYLPGPAGLRYQIRLRARDRVYNLEAWPPDSAAPQTTLYTWAITGSVRDNRGSDIAAAKVNSAPAAFEQTSGSHSYSLYVASAAESSGVTWEKAGYGPLALTTFTSSSDVTLNAVLPPADNALLNWDFEAAGGSLDGWQSYGSPQASMTQRHTGQAAAYLPVGDSSAPGDAASIAQAVTLSSTLHAPTLSFFYMTKELTAGISAALRVRISSAISSTSEIFSATQNTPWTHVWIDLSPWAGQDVTLTLASAQRPGGGQVWLDEISLGSNYPDLWANAADITAHPGEQVVTHLHYGNQGASAGEHITLSLKLPKALLFESAVPSPNQTLEGQQWTWELESLDAHTTAPSIVVTASVAGTATLGTAIPYTFSIAGALPEPEIANNRARANLWVGRRVHLPQLMKTATR